MNKALGPMKTLNRQMITVSFTDKTFQVSISSGRKRKLDILAKNKKKRSEEKKKFVGSLKKVSCGINLSDRLPLNLKQVSNNPSFLEEEEKKFEDLFGTKMKEENTFPVFSEKKK